MIKDNKKASPIGRLFCLLNFVNFFNSFTSFI